MLYNKKKKINVKNYALILAVLAVLLIFALPMQGCGNKAADDQNVPGAVSDNNASDVSSGNSADTEVSSGDAGKAADDPDPDDEVLSESPEDGDIPKDDSQSASNVSKKKGGNNSASDPDTSETPSQAQEDPVSEHASTVSSPGTAGALRVNGATLTDSAGNAVQLRGISTHGLAWFPDYVNEDCFRQLRDEWNVNVIRLAMYTAEYGGYCNGGNQEQLKTLIKNGVAYATVLDMYVIIDWHILSDSNPNTHKEEAKTFFSEMAQLYADQNNVLYEICNEPNGGTSWSQIKSYAEEIIPVIRAYDEDAVIIVGTPNWSQYVDQAAADPITGYDNIMYALHFYAATHKDSLRNTMTAAIDAGLPIFVTEYGICDASGNGAIDETQANQWISVMDEYNVSYVAWNLSNKNETSAILSSGCGKTSGFTEEDLSASGKWLYQMLTGKSAGTLAPPQTGSTSQTGGSTGNSSSSSTAPADSASGSPAPGSSASSSGAVSFTASLVNSWESDGKTFYQYDLTVSNTSGTDCSRWAVDVTFSDAITLSDGWNGDYTASGRTLHITCKDYNGSIPSGGSTGNVGFIISGNSGLTIIQ